MSSRRESTGKYWNLGAFWGLSPICFCFLRKELAPKKCTFLSTKRPQNRMLPGSETLVNTQHSYYYLRHDPIIRGGDRLTLTGERGRL